MSKRFQDIYDEALEFYKKGRCYDAAVYFEQARQIAKEYCMPEQAAEAGVWAVISWKQAYHPVKAYILLSDILSREDKYLGLRERWFAKKKVYELSANYSPQLEKLTKHLYDLQQLQQECPEFPIADIHCLAGQLLQYQGKWEKALEEWELSWYYWDEDNFGYLHYHTSEESAYCHLHLGNVEQAQYWCDLLGTTGTEWVNSRVAWYVLQANIAMYQKRWQEAYRLAKLAEEKADLCQPNTWALDISVRALLLQPDFGDPATANHPSRFRLKNRFFGKPTVFNKYDRALLITDYRLACIRYVLDIPAIDDYWYQQPQSVATSRKSDFNQSDLMLRIKKANQAIHRAMIQAQYLDGCFHCTWRQVEVQKRLNRLKELQEIIPIRYFNTE